MQDLLLEEGFISSQDLAEWFNTSANNFSKHKKDFLEKLKDYCDFENKRGGVEILEVYRPAYIKNKNYQIVEDNFDKYWPCNRPETCTHVGSLIHQDFEKQLTVKESTTIKHTAQARNVLYGKPVEEDSKGLKGTCAYIWCVKREDGEGYRYLTTEEEAIKQDLLIKYLGSADEKTALIQMAIDRGEIAEKDGWKEYSKLMQLKRAFPAFLNAFTRETGCVLVKGTQIEPEEGAFS